jgi:hypothetical protein
MMLSTVSDRFQTGGRCGGPLGVVSGRLCDGLDLRDGLLDLVNPLGLLTAGL